MKKEKRGFPYPVLIFLPLFLFGVLVGDIGLCVSFALLTAVVFALWPYLPHEPPTEGDTPFDVWIYRLHTDRALRNKSIAAELAVFMALVTGALVWYRNWLIPWRAALVLGLCALGLLWLLVDALLLRLRRKREEKDRSNYPLPTVNMTFDQAAMADSRAHALQTRLNQLEEWRRSGMIGSGEYEALRERAIRQLGTPDGAPKGDRPGKGE